jgi:hypothetical protein
VRTAAGGTRSAGVSMGSPAIVRMIRYRPFRIKARRLYRGRGWVRCGS